MISMFNSTTKPIQDVKVGEVLDNGDIVRGICKHLVKEHIYVELSKGILATPTTWMYKDTTIVRGDMVGHPQRETNPECLYAYQLITDSSMYPVIDSNKNRFMIIDELETTDKYYHAVKDSIITSGRFRSKLIVV